MNKFLLSTQFGKCIRFKSKKLRLFKGRSSKGIKGIKLNDKDKVISLSILENIDVSMKKIIKDKQTSIDKFILSVTAVMDMAKEHLIKIIESQIGGKGIIGIINSPRNGNISSSLVVNEDDEILLSTTKEV